MSNFFLVWDNIRSSEDSSTTEYNVNALEYFHRLLTCQMLFDIHYARLSLLSDHFLNKGPKEIEFGRAVSFSEINKR